MPRRCCCSNTPSCCSCDTVPSTISVKIKSGTYTLDLVEECYTITATDYTVWEGSFPLSNQYFPWNDPFDFTDDVVDVAVDTMNMRALVSRNSNASAEFGDPCKNEIYLQVWFTDSTGQAQTCLTGDGSFGSTGSIPSSTSLAAGQCVLSWVFRDSVSSGFESVSHAVSPCTDCRKMHFAIWQGDNVFPTPLLTYYEGSTDPRLTPAVVGTNCILANFDFFEVEGDPHFSDRKWIPEAIVSTNTTDIDCCTPCTDADTKTISTGTLAPGLWTEIDEWVLDHDGDCTWSAEFDITDCFQAVDTATSMKMTYSVEDAKNPAGEEGTSPRIFMVLYNAGGVPFHMAVYYPTDETDPDPELDGSLVCTPYNGGASGYPDSNGCPNAGGNAAVPGVPMFGGGANGGCYAQIGGWAYVKV